MHSIVLKSFSEDNIAELATAVACFSDKSEVIYLIGGLGAGKTTFAKYYINALGYKGNVKSPTFSIVELYELESKTFVAHFDLYRICSPDDICYLGIDDYDQDNHILLIEWPNHGHGAIPEATINVTIEFNNNCRDVILSSQNENIIQNLRKKFSSD
ncbi:MAG: tRNA (adenosine(37)-N6)-threonylcarbamoyltransferase complex ATPase subunit type 1 TsaE [Pseudomonadota bacterium]|nr:tRNA (adenosine(37)-N6)-threonylcarbamoyltransferase complex ATPase subunit type 1 TsaE [Pseudomonadota bacterium]